jgi:hypothetical protein
MREFEQGRYLGGRPPYGYRLADAGLHPNKAHAAWGRRAHRLEPDPQTAHIVEWIFAQRLAGHSVARIARALNEAGVPCPSASDPGRNPHRTGRAWTLGTVTTTLSNPRYIGHQEAAVGQPGFLHEIRDGEALDAVAADPRRGDVGDPLVRSCLRGFRCAHWPSV